MRRAERGSASVELAFSVPLLVFFFLLFVQIANVMVNQLAVMQVAREGARAAAVESSTAKIERAAQTATRLDRSRLDIDIGSRSSGFVTVRSSYRSRIVVPFTGVTLVQPVVSAQSTMAVEKGGQDFDVDLGKRKAKKAPEA